MKKVNKPVFMFFEIYSLLLTGLAWPGMSLTDDVVVASITANGHTFYIDNGFPEIAFKNATFTINLTDGAELSGYNWSSSVDWVLVNQMGVVTFGDIPSKDIKPIIITVTPKSVGNQLLYTFLLKYWFVNAGTKKYTISSAEKYCDDIGLSLPPYKLVTNAELTKVGKRDLGTLWGEWGNLKAYGWSTDVTYWTNDTGSEGYHYLTSLIDGYLYNDNNVGHDTGSVYVTCSNELQPTSDIRNVTANNHTFNVESGFPTIGFKGAEFKINIRKGLPDEKLNFSSNRNWVKVNNDGIVTIIEQPDTRKTDASITVTSESDNGVLTYSFSLDYWFVNAGTKKYTISSAEKYCDDIGLSLPPYKLVTNAKLTKVGKRDLGTLWGEWGNLKAYGWSTDVTYWTNDTGSEGYHYLTSLIDGYLYNDNNVGHDTGSVYVTCSNELQPTTDIRNVTPNQVSQKAK
ncbi:hypothetical protein ABEB36_005824 [Hypothenemus hampei]|uniref:Invasin domain-containing protein n=1 Tax=Hypothenemus hampei TaxID=57062 RepID=A0ABD1F072_HYPHA